MAGSIQDWSECLASLVAASNSSLAHSTVNSIVKLIIDNENEIMNHGNEFECFYSSFLALAAHQIAINLTSLEKTELGDYSSACRIIISYLLLRLQHPHDGCTVSKKHQMSLLSSLCKASSSTSPGAVGIGKSDIVTFTALLKSAKTPALCSSKPTDSIATAAEGNAPHLPASRADSRLNITSQITSVFDDTSLPMFISVGSSMSMTSQQSSSSATKANRASKQASSGANTSSDTDGDLLRLDDLQVSTSSSRALHDQLLAKNVHTLQSLNGSEVLLELCMSLVYLKRYRAAYVGDVIKDTEFVMPSVVSDALLVRMSLQSVMTDVGIVWQVVSLPILEPMTRTRLSKIVAVVMSCLQAALAAAVATSIVSMSSASTQARGACKEDEIDGYAGVIVLKALDIFKNVSTAIKNSSKAGGHVLQNYKMLGAWAILKGLNCLLQHCSNIASERAKDSSEVGTSITIAPVVHKEAWGPTIKDSKDATTSVLKESWSVNLKEGKESRGAGKDAGGVKESVSGKDASGGGGKELGGKTKDGGAELSKPKHGGGGGADTKQAHGSGVATVRSVSVGGTATKLASGFGGVCVSLSSQLIQLLASLLDDVQLESQSVGTDARDNSATVADLTLYGEYLAIVRVRKLLQVISLPELLFQLLAQSFKKAVSHGVGRQTHSSSGGGGGKLDDSTMDVCDTNSNSSDSNTFYEEDFSSSDDSNDDDSEPILGLWFEETLSAKDTTPKSESSSAGRGADDQTTGSRHGRHHSGSDHVSFATDRREPESFIRLAIDVLQFIDHYILHSNSADVRSCMSRTSLGDAQMICLASLIRDMDAADAHDLVRGGSGGGVTATVSSYEAFSYTVAHFMHTLIGSDALSDTLQDKLLDDLGVSFQTNKAWPLNIRPRALAVIAEVLLVRQQREKGDSTASSADIAAARTYELSIISIWNRFIDTLTDAAIISLTGSSGVRADDVNVEHFQLLVFLFHGLTLMQKKSLWLHLCQSITRVYERCNAEKRISFQECIPLALTRLLLLADYLLHYFYDLPPSIVDQVRYNLFGIHCAGSERSGESGSTGLDKDVANKRFFVCRELEDTYMRNGGYKPSGASEARVKPKFYNIGPAEYSAQDTPKVDGLACSFMLSNPDVLNYNKFYEAVMMLLLAGSKLFDVSAATDKLPLTESCSVHYHFTVSWRLLAFLPPSVDFLRSLTSPEFVIRDLSSLHSLRWLPRLSNNSFQKWTKDHLIKQGESQQSADALISSVVNATRFSIQFDLDLVVKYLRKLITGALGRGLLVDEDPDYVVSSTAMPPLSMLYTLDAIIAKIHAELDHYDVLVTATKVSDTDAGVSTTTSGDPKHAKIAETCGALMSCLLPIIRSVVTYGRSGLLNQLGSSFVSSSSAVLSASASDDSQFATTPDALRAYNSVMRIGSSRVAKSITLGETIMVLLPAPVRIACDKWNGTTCAEFPAISSWRNAFASDSIPLESYTDSILSAHLTNLSTAQNISTAIGSALKHVLLALVRLCSDLSSWFPDAMEASHIVDILFPIYFDVACENLCDTVIAVLDRLIGPADTKAFALRTAAYLADVSHSLVLRYSSTAIQAGSCAVLDERVLHASLTYLETQLDSPSGKSALEKYYSMHPGDLTTILLSTAGVHLTTKYTTHVLKFFNRLLQLADKNPLDQSYEEMCIRLQSLASLDSSRLQAWLTQMMMPVPSSDTSAMLAKSANNSYTSQEEKIQENRALLQGLTSYIVKPTSHVNEDVSNTILNALIPMASLMLSGIAASRDDSASAGVGGGFTELMTVMTMLAGSGSGAGHTALFKASVEWLDLCKNFLAQKNVAEKIEENETEGRHQLMLDSACCLLAYIKDVLTGLRLGKDRLQPMTSFGSGTSPISADTELHFGIDAIGAIDTDEAGDDMDLGDDESLGGDDSDEESLNNKLCTYTVTQKEFMNQHWYHCHTCKMVDGVGVCTICARVCHKDHDLSYAKYGSFFCDCGAKEDNRCLALTKRSSSTLGGVADNSKPSQAVQSGADATMKPQTSTSEIKESRDTNDIMSSSTSSTAVIEKASNKLSEVFIRQIQNSKDTLMSYLATGNIHTMLIDLLQFLMPSLVRIYEELSSLGGVARAQQAVKDLREMPKTIEMTDSLMVATLGSQEGAFENVRINYSGDQGQTIRQLITSHVLRRVGMCCLTSPHGKRQHLAVSNEKGKVTILQLSALLKQAHSSKRKLTLTRLSSASIPFTVLGIAGSPCNEDFLAVCGLKDCHVLTFTSTGSVADHLVLHPTLETGNFIIKAIWLPGSQTELAIVTADFVKVYDLALDALSPQYYFLLPTGKIRDVTFMYTEVDGVHLVLMGSSGYIYTQVMDDSSSARHGPFYITNILDVKHPEIKETGGQIAGGGVSVYYSHTMQLLFFSYAQGRSFAAPVTKITEELTTMFQITLKGGSNGSGSGVGGGKSSGGGSAGNGQALVQWMEVHNHPGLVCCMTQSTNNPVVLMIKPDSIAVQEIKIMPAKAKIQDMVVIRHLGSNSDQRTTLILLCEDGSLRIYMANIEQTNYWMSATLKPCSSLEMNLKPNKQKSLVSSGRPAGQVTFTVDYFEHCQPSTDIEFGGADVLHIYNTQQVKHRLNTTGLYIASTKPGGFNIEVSNINASTVMVGVRVLVGSQTLDRAPGYIELFGRRTNINLTRHRWYDLPFTRDEALTADKKFILTFGPSSDPAGVIMIDSIKVYTKSKESFGWPDDVDESPESTQTKVLSNSSSAGAGGFVCVDSEMTSSQMSTSSTGTSPVPLSLTSVDRLLVNSMEVLDGCFAAGSHQVEERDPIKTSVLQLSAKLLTLSTPAQVQQQTKVLMSSLFASRSAYHWHKDKALLDGATRSLAAFCTDRELSCESFQRLVYVARSIAVARPTNLVRFAEQWNAAAPSSTENLESDVDIKLPEYMHLQGDERNHFVSQLNNAFWFLLSRRVENPLTGPVCMSVFTHVETVVMALVEIMHAFTCTTGVRAQGSNDMLTLLCKLYARMLLAEDAAVSFTCKQALVRVIKPRVLHSSKAGHGLQAQTKIMTSTAPPAPTGAESQTENEGERSASSVRQADTPQPSPAEPEEEILEPEPMFIEPAGPGGVQAAAAANQGVAAAAAAAVAAGNALEALLAGGGADDETMVQLAIALSLQDQAGGGAGLAGGALNFPSGLGAQLQAMQLEAGHLSDTTASGPASEDEGEHDEVEDDEDEDEDDEEDDVDDEDEVEEEVREEEVAESAGALASAALHTSPTDHAEAGGAAGSDSGGSNVDSVSVSGRSSAYGDVTSTDMTALTSTAQAKLANMAAAQSDAALAGLQDHDWSDGVGGTTNREGCLIGSDSQNLHSLSLRVLEKLVSYLPALRDVTGVRCIPYMQLVLSLMAESDSDNDSDREIIDNVLTALISELRLNRDDVSDMSSRTNAHEVQLIILRLLSVLMSRTKHHHQSGSRTSGVVAVATVQHGASLSNKTSSLSTWLSYKLLTGNGLEYCLRILQTLLEYTDQNTPQDVEGNVMPRQLLKPRPVGTPPDMSPFFLREYVKGHCSDVFEEYRQLLMEIALRLAYQMRKIGEECGGGAGAMEDEVWHRILAEYMMTTQVTYVKKKVRKLLLYTCGSKERYRHLRDIHTLEKHMTSVREICGRHGLDDPSTNFNAASMPTAFVSLSYNMLINLIEHLKDCLEIATARPHSWQKYCQKEEGLLAFLILASIRLDDGVAPLVLQLLQCAICGTGVLPGTSGLKSDSTSVAIKLTTSSGSTSASTASGTSSSSHVRHRKRHEDRAKEQVDGAAASSSTMAETPKKKEDSDTSLTHASDALCSLLVQHICKTVSRELLVRFIVCFLLESNISSVRWQAHALVLHIYINSSISQREWLLDVMWSVWPELPSYGSKASQFVDLLGYFTIKTPQASESKTRQYMDKALSLLRLENKILSSHPNRPIYNALQGLVDFDGYYLERDPCLVCNNPEVPYTNMKLSAIKVDSKFTTSTHIIKLAGSHNISRISLKITDLKRTKMVRTLNVYYNNRQVQAVVELKNKPGLWHKAKKIILSAGQTELKADLPLPIVACNLMIEYADFYDNLQATSETLQCPRCSASVPANPGVCGNCGENVFQCHKCRAINYDEKDPFLCNACGYCKYAKFDFSLNTKPCCAVDPIETDEDRKKAVSTINTLLERADHLYRQLQLYKPALDTILVRVNDHSIERDDPTSSMGGGGTGGGGGGAAPSTAGGSNATGASAINKHIQLLAQKYCVECKAAFEDLGKIIQKVLASRKELVEYDRQRQEAALSANLPISTPSTPSINTATLTLTDSLTHFGVREQQQLQPARPRERRCHCFGCTTATVEHCLTLLRAMATSSNLKHFLSGQGLIRELVDYNLRHGSPSLRTDVRHLLCLICNDSASATDELDQMLCTHIRHAIQTHLTNPDFAGSVRHEMLLLSNLLQLDDSYWEQRIRCVLQLFVTSIRMQSPAIVECISLPCLRILQQIIKPASPTSKKNKDKSLDSLYTVRLGTELHVDVNSWLAGDPASSFQVWKRAMHGRHALAEAPPAVAKKKKDDKQAEKRAVRSRYLTEKYAMRWRSKLTRGAKSSVQLHIADKTWLRAAMFNASSATVRRLECDILETMCLAPARKQHILDMLTGFLEEVGSSGEAAAEYLALYEKLISTGHWKYYLALKGVLVTISSLLTKEIEELSKLENTTLSSDLSQGFALKALTKLLSVFLEVPTIKQMYKSRLVGSVLNGYLSLRKLVVQRTKIIDDTQEKLLEQLEEMTTGTESETKEFMSVCVDTVNKYPLDDFLSPVFIFERLCSIIYPEANESGEFFMSLEKDPQQEDFLQGRMLSNPYSSTNPGLGPLMRDVKNKICQDCELVALLEDDTGMELLVCNKIISLDLAVSDVHRKIWLPEHGEAEPMRIVYRMRGLLGDATEDMVNSLDSGKDEDVDNEEVYKMANVMQQCGGLKVMLIRLAAVRNLVAGKQVMTVLLKLFTLCLKVKANRQELVKKDMNSISIMLGALNLALLAEQESGASTKGQTLTEQILQIMETILLEASGQPPELYKEFSKLCGDKDQLMMLLDRINSPFVRANTGILQALMRFIPFLAFGDPEKMLALVSHFKPYLDFNKFDFEHTQDELVHVDCFCVIAAGIESNVNGCRLKDLILSKSIVADTLHYIQMHAPSIKAQSDGGDSWKEFISKPSLPYALRLLTGLCRGHEPTQVMIADEIIPILHNMEQISSDEHVGSLAENLLEALRENANVALKIEEVRQQTKAEKKRLAMAMRQKQLGQLGMMTNEKGQVTVKSSALKHMDELNEETGLTCCICREGYRYQPAKVLGIYTFTKRVNLDDGENKPRKTQGYSTVSHFNIIHVDCHLAAVRHARGREEWDSAALQNGNTKCNGLMPLWGPQVPEPAYASCLARHNTYIQECTAVRDATYVYTMHDVKHLLLKFAFEKSFSEDSGGGGRESNIHLIPYLMHMALYVINTTRAVAREEKNLANFLKLPAEKWVENSFETEGALYWTVVSTHMYNHDAWKKARTDLLMRIIVLAHVRHVMPGGGTSVSDKTVKEYSVYKPYLLFFGLADFISTVLFKKCTAGTDNWTTTLADYIRNNDQTLQEQSKKMLSTFEGELMPCESLTELVDVLGLLEEIAEPDTKVKQVLSKLP